MRVARVLQEPVEYRRKLERRIRYTCYYFLSGLLPQILAVLMVVLVVKIQVGMVSMLLLPNPQYPILVLCMIPVVRLPQRDSDFGIASAHTSPPHPSTRDRHDRRTLTA